MGGKNTPASGFALYLDRLMNLVSPKTLAKPVAQRILVRVEPGQPQAAKKGFDIAGVLHDAGCVAEVHPGGREPANLRWILDVQSGAPPFILTDGVKHRKIEAQTAEEILALLGE